jgi:hypothetical protein
MRCGLFRKKLRGGFGGLINRNDDCLDVLVAPPLPQRSSAMIRRRL